VDWKSVVNIHYYEDRHMAVYSVCLPSAGEDIKFLSHLLTLNINVNYKPTPGLQINLPGLPQSKLYTCQYTGAPAIESCLSLVVMCCIYQKYNYWSKDIPRSGGIAPLILNRSIRQGEWPAARTGCVITLNKQLVISVRKLFGFQS
jgi:hypothetical protein